MAFLLARDDNELEPACRLRFASFVELLLRLACLKFGGCPSAVGLPAGPDAARLSTSHCADLLLGHLAASS